MKKQQAQVTDNSYDKVPYMSQTFQNTQPNHTSIIANLFGVKTSNIKHSRVLEIGCSFGGNLIPLAISNPRMKLVGIDLGEIQIREGNKIIKQLGLKNIKLKQQNILDYKNDLGKFDYIICHGVFSWVPKEVQNKIIDVIQKSLKEDGLAVISYNTNPGWKNISTLRDVMLFRTEFLKKRGVAIDSPELLVDYGKKAIDFIQDYSTLGDTLKPYVESIANKNTHYLYHEYFEEFNEAFYLYQFNNMLEENGLMHLSDADLSKTIPLYSNAQKDINMDETLNIECRGDRIAKEQYYDYLFNQQFRISIIGHKDKIEKAEVSKDIKCKNLDKLHLRQLFTQQADGSYIIGDKALSSDYAYLVNKLNAAYPNTVSIKELCADNNSEEQNLYAKALFLVYGKFVESFLSPITIETIEKPCLKPIWKKYLTYFINNENPMISLAVFNGTILNVNNLQLKILLSLDGSVSREDSIKNLLQAKEKGEINITLSEGNTEEEEITKFINNLFRLAEMYKMVK